MTCLRVRSFPNSDHTRAFMLSSLDIDCGFDSRLALSLCPLFVTNLVNIRAFMPSSLDIDCGFDSRLALSLRLLFVTNFINIRAFTPSNLIPFRF